jgi:MFS family permease
MSNLQRLILAKFLGNLHFAIPLQTFFFFEKGFSMQEILLLESMFFMGVLLFEIPTGMLGDTIGRKWSLVCGSIVGLIGWIPWLLADSFFTFAIAFLMVGISASFYSGSDQALIYDELKSQKREHETQKIMGWYMGSMTLGVAVAALIGGFIGQSNDLDSLYQLYYLTMYAQAIGLLVLLTVREPAFSETAEQLEHEPERGLKLFSSGLKHILGSPDLRRIALLYISTMPFTYILIYTFQPYFQNAGIPTSFFGTAVFVSAVLSFISKISAHKIEKIFGINRGTYILTMLPGVLWLCMAALVHPVFAVILYWSHDAASSARDPVFADYLNRHIPSRNRATILSTISFCAMLHGMLIRPVIGYIADINLSWSFVAMGAMIVIGATAFRFRNRETEMVV